MEINYNPTYQQLAQRTVFKFRIAVHTLGQHYENENSENHVSINALLGNGLSLRFDMQLDEETDNEENLGQLLLHGRDQTQSESMIRILDIKASGCPPSFDPSAAPPRPTSASHSVQQFRDLIVNRRLHHFRFLLVDGHSDGCRHWALTVMTAFREAGYLHRDENLGTMSTLLEQKWDRNQQPRAWTVIPGLFIQPRDSCTAAAMNSILRLADSASLSQVADAIVKYRRGDPRLPAAILAFSAQGREQERANLIQTNMIPHVKGVDREIAVDLLRAGAVVQQRLMTVLLRARQVDQAARALDAVLTRRLDDTASRMALVLAAVIDMAGELDE